MAEESGSPARQAASLVLINSRSASIPATSVLPGDRGGAFGGGGFGSGGGVYGNAPGGRGDGGGFSGGDGGNGGS